MSGAITSGSTTWKGTTSTCSTYTLLTPGTYTAMIFTAGLTSSAVFTVVYYTTTVPYVATFSESPAYANTISVTTTYSPTFSVSPSYANTVSVTTTYSPTLSVSPSYANTVSATTTYSPTFSASPSYTNTVSENPTYSATFTGSPGYTPQVSVSPSYGISILWSAAYGAVESALVHFIASLSTILHVVGGDNSYLKLGSDLWASSVTVSGSGVYYFNNAALGSFTFGSPFETFGLKLNHANGTLSVIDGDHIEESVTGSGTSKSYFYYVMPYSWSLLYSVPQSVVYTSGGSTRSIPQSSYLTSASAFASCSAPCVYSNPSNSTLILKSTASSFTVDWYFPPYGAGTVVLTVAICVALGVGFLLAWAKRRRRVPP